MWGSGSPSPPSRKGGDPAPLLADLRQVLGEFAQNGVPAELVEASKKQEVAQLAFATDSISGLATAWSNALAFAGAESPDDVAKAYEAVTLADVNRLARELLDPDHAITAILTPRASPQPGTSAGFGGAESFNSVPDHPVTLPPWASAALASLHVPDPGPPPDVSVLPNGLRLIVQPSTSARRSASMARCARCRTWRCRPARRGWGRSPASCSATAAPRMTGWPCARHWTTSRRPRAPGRASRSRC